MTINYQSGAKRYKVETPTRKQLIKKYARRRYRSTVSLLTNNDSMFDHVLDSVVKNIKVAQNYSCMVSPEKIQMLAMTQPLLITILK